MKKFRTILFNFLIISLFISPQTTFFYFFNILLLGFLVYISKPVFERNSLIIACFFTLSLLFSFLEIGNFYINKDLLKSFVTLFFIIFILKFNLKNTLNLKILIFTSTLLIFSQVVYILGIDNITTILDSIYPFNEEQMVWTHRSISSLQFIEDFRIRGGGIYRNPNQYSKYLCLLYLLILNIYKSRLSKPNQLIITLIFLISILLTGSRAGFIIFSIIGILNFKSGKSNKFILLIVAGVVLSLVNFISIRSLNIINAIYSGSLSKRMNSIDFFLQELDLRSLFFGHFYHENTLQTFRNISIMFDSDLISLLFSYGIIGSIIIIFKLKKIIVLNKAIWLWPIMVFSITSGILFDLNFFLLIITVIYFTKFYKNEYNLH